MSSYYRSILNVQGSSFASTNSFEFDGSTDYVEVADADNLSFGDSVTDSPFSISAWVNMNSSNGFRILGKRNSTRIEYTLSFNSGATANKLVFKLFDKVNSIYIGKRSFNTYQSLENTWAHIVATYDGSSSSTGIKLYINDSQISVNNDNVGTYTAMHNTASPLEIAKLNTSYANGKIDELAIFDVELSSTEVTNIYNSGVPNNLNDLSNPPLSWWRMGEAANYSGGQWTLTDQGSGGNDGTSSTIPAPPAQPSTDVPT